MELHLIVSPLQFCRDNENISCSANSCSLRSVHIIFLSFSANGVSAAAIAILAVLFVM